MINALFIIHLFMNTAHCNYPVFQNTVTTTITVNIIVTVTGTVTFKIRDNVTVTATDMLTVNVTVTITVCIIDVFGFYAGESSKKTAVG